MLESELIGPFDAGSALASEPSAAVDSDPPVSLGMAVDMLGGSALVI